MEPDLHAFQLPVSLSKRELQVLEGIARGDTDKETAARLGITLGTTRVYRKRLQTKLRVREAVPMFLVAWKLDLIDAEALAGRAMARFEAHLRRNGRDDVS